MKYLIAIALFLSLVSVFGYGETKSTLGEHIPIPKIDSIETQRGLEPQRSLDLTGFDSSLLAEKARFDLEHHKEIYQHQSVISVIIFALSAHCLSSSGPTSPICIFEWTNAQSRKR